MHGYILGTTTNRINRHWQSGNTLPHTIARGSRLAGVIDPQDGTFYNLPYAFGYPGFSGVIDNPHNYYIEMRQLSFVYGVKFKYSDNITKCVQVWKSPSNATLESCYVRFTKLTKFNFMIYHEFDRNGHIIKKDDFSVGFDAGKPIKRDIITHINNTEYVFIDFWYRTGGESELPPEIIAKMGECEEINPEDKGDAVFGDRDRTYTYKYESRRITSWVRKWLGTIPEFSIDYEGRTLKAVYTKEADNTSESSFSSFSMTGVMTDAAVSTTPSKGNKLSDFSGEFGYLAAVKLFLKSFGNPFGGLQDLVENPFDGIEDLYAPATCWTTAWYTAGQPRPMIGNEAYAEDFARIQKSWWSDKAAMLVGATGVPESIKKLGKDVVIIQGKEG